MRLINTEGESSADGGKRIVSQLDFIKLHLRYPLDRRTLWPVIALGSILPGLYIAFTAASNHDANNRSSVWVLAVVCICLFVPVAVTFRRFLLALKFISVPADASTGDNIILLQKFFKDHKLAYRQLPGTPEVYQIISTSISSLKDEREVVFFVADNNRILINSHFTRSRLISPMGTPSYPVIAQRLEAWIAITRGGSSIRKSMEAKQGLAEIRNRP
jgi:hypothetical protein